MLAFLHQRQYALLVYDDIIELHQLLFVQVDGVRVVERSGDSLLTCRIVPVQPVNLACIVHHDLDDFDFESDDPKSFDTATIGEFSELDVNLRVGGIKIERGNKWEIQAKYSKEYLKPSYTLKNRRLSISQPGYKNKNVGNNKCNIVITVPFGTELDKLSMSIDVGAVELSGFDIKKGSIDTDVGAIEIKNVGFEDFDLDSDVGAISIELVEPLETYNITVNSDLGGIVVDEKNVRRHYSQKGTSNKKLRIDTDVGGIEIK